MQRPVIDIVLRNQRANGRLVVPGDAPALQHVARRRAKMHHIALCNARLALKLDPEAAPHAARTTIAAGEIGTAYCLGLPRHRLAHDRPDAVGILRAVLKSRTELADN